MGEHDRLYYGHMYKPNGVSKVVLISIEMFLILGKKGKKLNHKTPK